MKGLTITLCVFTILSVFVAESFSSPTPVSLTIKRVELYFENNRPEITVEKDRQKLKAFAKLAFASSGLLEGYWEVDGRIISRVSEHLTSGNTVVLETSDAVQLPTFDPGTHVVKFIITNPLEKTLPTPSLLYFVAVQGFQRSQDALKLVKPTGDASLKYEPPTFIWERFTINATYIVQFYKDPSSTPLFSACTMDVSYKLPSVVFRELFKPGMKYYWKVKGNDGKKEAESTLQEFRFKTIR